MRKSDSTEIIETIRSECRKVVLDSINLFTILFETEAEKKKSACRIIFDVKQIKLYININL